MKLSKFLLGLCVITILCLFYVRQQTEVFRLAYISQKNLTAFKDSLDKNTFLRYNIGKNASLVRIGKKISGADNYEMPDTYRLVRLVSGNVKERHTRYSPPKANIVLRLFSIKRQAEAKTVNP